MSLYLFVAINENMEILNEHLLNQLRIGNGENRIKDLEDAVNFAILASPFILEDHLPSTAHLKETPKDGRRRGTFDATV